MKNKQSLALPNQLWVYCSSDPLVRCFISLRSQCIGTLISTTRFYNTLTEPDEIKVLDREVKLEYECTTVQ